jgi:hypothetical protein
MNQLHPDLKVKEVLIKDKEGFRLRLKKWKCIAPADLNALEFIQESLDDKGEVSMTSTYNFFMSDNELKVLAASLVMSDEAKTVENTI